MVSGRIARWMFLLQEYNFKVICCLRMKCVLAEHLPRIESGERAKRSADQFLDVILFIVHIQPKENWKSPFVEHLTHGILLSTKTTKNEQNNTRRVSEPYALADGKLMKVSMSGQVKICISGGIIEKIISKTHEREGVHHPLQQTSHQI